MNNSLDNIKETMKEKVIAALTDIRYMPKHEREAYKQKLLDNTNGRLLTTTVRTQNGLTDANDYNQTAYELYLDMITTFGYINELYNTISNHQHLNESIINTLYSNIAALNDKLDEYEAVIGIDGRPECYIEGFRTQNNQEWDPKYYTERYGEIVPETAWVKFNSEQENITLDYSRQQNVMVYQSGVQLGTINITKQYGAGFIKARNSEVKLNNAIDTSPATYWAETILANAEMKVTGGEYSDASGFDITSRSYYDLPKGAMCELCLTFESLAKINEIVLKPYGNFPIDIIAIRYSLSDDEDDEAYDIVCPDNIVNDWLCSRTIRQEYAFHFHEIQCKKLYILINQIHCIKNTCLLSSNQMFKNELWFNATYDNLKNPEMDNTTVFKPLYLDRAEDNPIWKYLNNKLVTNKEIDINDILIANENRYTPSTKYQYTYGFYNIAPNYVEFQKAGVYVSQEIEVSGPIDTITLTSDEEHFRTTDGFISTDIEFYITSKKNPSYNDWLPICPQNKDYVYKEKLQIDYAWCNLRHHAVCSNITVSDAEGNQKIEMERPIVYMNDVVLTEDVDYILHYNDDGFSVHAIEISNIDHFALYTVSYMPMDSSKELSLIDKDNPIPSNSYEEIMGNGTACYELDSYPFYNKIDTSLTNSYVKIINTETGEVLIQTNQDSSPIQCVTNKECTADSYKNFIANTNKIQYYTNGRHVYFNRPISKHEKIEINYPSFDCKIRVKAILRRNSKRDSWITPVLNKYTLHFTTI